MHLCVYVCLCVCVHMAACRHRCACTCVYVCMFVCVHMVVYVCVYVPAYTQNNVICIAGAAQCQYGSHVMSTDMLAGKDISSLCKSVMDDSQQISPQDPLYQSSGSQTFWAMDPFAVKYFSEPLVAWPILKIFRHKPTLCQEAYSYSEKSTVIAMEFLSFE